MIFVGVVFWLISRLPVVFDRSTFYSWGTFLEIKLDEAFVIPMMPVILGKNFY
jgi:hypothetical protein